MLYNYTKDLCALGCELSGRHVFWVVVLGPAPGPNIINNDDDNNKSIIDVIKFYKGPLTH